MGFLLTSYLQNFGQDGSVDKLIMGWMIREVQALPENPNCL
jgi:hypothetical protein